MAWVERRGNRYRVRHWTPDGHAATAGVFATRDAAKEHADTLTTPPAPQVAVPVADLLPMPHPAPSPPAPAYLSLPLTPPPAHPAPPWTPAAPPAPALPSSPGLPTAPTAPITQQIPAGQSHRQGWPARLTPPPASPLLAPPERGLPARMTTDQPTPTQIIALTPHPGPPPPLVPVPAAAAAFAPHSHPHPGAYQPVREVLLTDWVQRWWLTLDIGPNTACHYRSLLKNHILPRWGAMPLHHIIPSDVTLWLKSLHQRYARTTVTSIGKLLSLLMAGAVIEGHLTTNPVHLPRRRGRERDHHTEDQMWATEHEVIALARRITYLAGPTQGLLVITAAYTGMRWGELAALRRTAHDHQAATLTIHREDGNLLEVNGHHSYGPPKTAASVRTVTLPPLLNTLLQQDQTRHKHDHLFTSRRGNNLRRSAFSRRQWIPATQAKTLPDGTTWPALKPGLTFHNLRHTHKTWLIEDNIPDVAQARRLGHTLKGIDDVYAHVATTVNDRLLAALEARWHRSLTHHALPQDNPGS
ncbi:tyrosine-type recombinase/integrase [Streptomyces sp. NPDC050738]|uniref:tyrosine-type recombinase/integrase n=1 Tax=Streptomyces sp. NPDC050738 TaxID=3154744 RepID=UPI003425C0B3